MNDMPTPAATSYASADTLTEVDVVPTTPARPVAATISPLTPQAVTKGMKTMIRNTEDLVAFGKDNVEAFVAAGKIWAEGVQGLTQQVASTAKASLEESVATFKALSSVKSLKEAFDLQTSYGKTVIAKTMAESNRLTDASIKLTEQTLAPITARVAVAVETIAKAA